MFSFMVHHLVVIIQGSSVCFIEAYPGPERDGVYDNTFNRVPCVQRKSYCIFDSCVKSH